MTLLFFFTKNIYKYNKYGLNFGQPTILLILETQHVKQAIQICSFANIYYIISSITVKHTVIQANQLETSKCHRHDDAIVKLKYKHLTADM